MGSFKIKKGSHYSRRWPVIHLAESVFKFKFKFGLGCWFPLLAPDDYAVNKLCGFSYGYHHHNSIRCGWTPNKVPNKIDLFFYMYSGGVREVHYFATVDLSVEYELVIHASMNQVSFSLRHNGLTLMNPAYYFKKPKFRLGYILWPYIGGQLPARQDTYIDLTL